MLNTNISIEDDYLNDGLVNNHECNIQSFISNYTQEKTIDFHAYIQGKFLYQLSLINDFQTYLNRDDLNICYQPIIDLDTGKTTSVEALIRWQHKIAGPISPEIFIPILERTGHIHALTFWVLNHTLQQMNSWKSEGINIDVAVNLSMFNLHDDNFPDQISRLLDKWSVPPEKLILEITEGVIMYNPDQAINVLGKLNKLGVRLALDDFGTGYSSLSHLARLPISELKIDRSLVAGIDKNNKNAMIVRSTIELAQKLGLKIVAEGVENTMICNILKSYGCDTAQGFLFSKPVNETEFELWFKKNCYAAYN